MLCITLTHPNECYISTYDTENKQLVKRYLNRWQLTSNPNLPAAELTPDAIYLACQLCESASLVMAAPVLATLGNSAKTLSQFNAFSAGFKAKHPNIYIDGRYVCLTPDVNGKWGYFDPQCGRVNVTDNALTLYRFDVNLVYQCHSP